MESALAVFSFAARRLRKRWGITLVVVLSISIGVAASTTTLGWVQSILVNPLPTVPDQDRILALVSKTNSGERLATSNADFRDLKESMSTLTGLAAFREDSLSFERNGNSRRIWAMSVSGGFFDVLEIRPVIGTFFGSDPASVDTTGGARLAVISYRLWEDEFLRDPSVIGSKLLLNGQAYTVSGVAPAGFDGTVVGLAFDLWVPLMQRDALLGGDNQWQEERRHRSLNVIGKRSGLSSLEDVQVELGVVAARLARDYPEQNVGISFQALKFADAPFGAQSLLADRLKLMYVASGLVLLIVCVNLITLLLVLTTERQREFGVRSALGATRSTIFLQVLAEGVLLGLLAAALSILAAHYLSGLLRFFVPDLDLPIALEPRTDRVTLVYALGASVCTAVLANFLPAIRASSIDLTRALTDITRSQSVSRTEQHVQTTLVVAQIALAYIALSSAALFLNGYKSLTERDLGFEASGVTLMATAATRPGLDAAAVIAYANRLQTGLVETPGVRSAAFAEWVPMGLHGGSWEELQVQGYSPAQDENMRILRNLVSPAYFETIGVPILSGRDFSSRDVGEAPAVAIINEEFARRFFRGRDPLGMRLIGWGRELTVVGIARDSRYTKANEPPRPYFYVPFAQFANPGMYPVFHISSAISAREASEMAMSASRNAGSEIYAIWTKPMSKYIQASLFGERVTAIILGALGAAAIFIAALGIYGMMAYSVAQRVSEMGTRMALGASSRIVLGLVARRGARLTVAGIATGLLGAIVAGEKLRALIGGVVSELWIHAAVVTALALVAMLACLVPGLRIARLQPVDSLKG